MGQPAVAASIEDSGADNVVFDTDENVISVTDVSIQPEVDFAFGNFSSGIDTMELEITVQVEAEQEGEYEGSKDTWDAPVDGSSESITISDTVTADGTEETYEPGIGIGTFTVQTPDLTGTTDAELGDNDNFVFQDAISVQEVLEEDGGIDTGIEMSPRISIRGTTVCQSSMSTTR